MNTLAFDAIARRAADGVSRRGALMTVAGAGLAAALAPPVAVTAKKKAKKKAKAKCQGQAEQCAAFIEDFCEHSACEDAWEPVLFCCQFLEQCNANGFLECISLV